MHVEIIPQGSCEGPGAAPSAWSGPLKTGGERPAVSKFSDNSPGATFLSEFRGMPRDIQMPTVAKSGRPGTRPAGPRSPILNRRPCSVLATGTRAMGGSWNTKGACRERERYLVILERHRSCGHPSGGAWHRCEAVSCVWTHRAPVAAPLCRGYLQVTPGHLRPFATP